MRIGNWIDRLLHRRPRNYAIEKCAVRTGGQQSVFMCNDLPFLTIESNRRRPERLRPRLRIVR